MSALHVLDDGLDQIDQIGAIAVDDGAPCPTTDLAGATDAARQLLRALGADLGAPGLADTPERMTVEIANWLQDQLQPKGVGVVIEAEHLCMSIRGVRLPGSRTTTSSVHGVLRDDPRSRQEFFALTRLEGR